MTESIKIDVMDYQDVIATALSSYLPAGIAAARAIEIEKVLIQGPDGKTEYMALWDILGQLDDYPVPIAARAAAVSAVLHAWRRVTG